MKLNIGDYVSTCLDGLTGVFIYAGSIENKVRLLIPGVPGASICVDKDLVW